MTTVENMDGEDGHQVGSMPACFAPPSVACDAAVHERVLSELESGPGRLAVVAAPAGYGKTTHVAMWARRTDLPLAWVDLDASHDGPVRLLGLLVDALQAVSDIDASQVSRSGASLGRALRGCSRPFALVIDDAHHVRHAAAVEVLDALVANMPEGSRVVVIGRSIALPSVARLRVGAGVTELRDADLALDGGGVRAMLASFGLEFGPDDVERLVADTEGWPVGVRLAALARREGVPAAAVSVSGADADVSEYVHAEWLRGLDDDEAEFLSLASAVDWLSGPLCDELCGVPGSGAMLERLSASRLLVVPLDRRHERYRMHNLLRDMLQVELLRTRPDEHRRVHVRASEWYELHGDGDRAVQHAVRAGDLDRAERLVIRYLPDYQIGGMIATLERWVAAFPADRLRSSPGLGLLVAVAALGKDNEATLAWLALCRRTLEQAGRLQSGDAIALQFLAFEGVVWSGPLAPVLESTARARDGLPPGVWHALACQALGAHTFAAGLDDLAIETLAEGVQEARLFGARTIELHCDALLARAHHHAGDTDRAARLALDVRRRLDEFALEHVPTAMLITATTAWAAAYSGDPDTARADLVLCRRSLEAMRGLVYLGCGADQSRGCRGLPAAGRPDVGGRDAQARGRSARLATRRGAAPTTARRDDPSGGGSPPVVAGRADVAERRRAARAALPADQSHPRRDR